MEGAAGGYRGIRELLLRRRSDLERRGAFLQRELAPIFARRRRRTVFGVTLMLSSLCSFAAAGLGTFMSMRGANLTQAAVLPLASALPLAFTFAWLGTLFTRKRSAPPLPPLPETHARDEQALFDLQIAEAELEAYPKAFEKGVSWSLVGLGWILPLSLHYIVALVVGETRDFGGWIALSILIALQSHIALAWLSYRFGRHVQSDVPVNVHLQWLKTVGITTLVASVPWILFLGIPTVITAMTGLAFIPAMYLVTARRVKSERARVERIVAASFEELAPESERRIELQQIYLAPSQVAETALEVESELGTVPVAERAFR